jgi:non-specific serine/threonine protein kinase
MSSPSITVTPSGHFLLVETEDADAALTPRVAERLREAWARGPEQGLLHLGLVETDTTLPAVLGFWRDLSKHVVNAACTTPGIEDLRDRFEVKADPEALAQALDAAPPMVGGEYLRLTSLDGAQASVAEALREELRAAPGQTVQAFLASRNENWHVVGRVHFHLAENRRDPERPFAFLATYTTGISQRGSAQHRPLGDAVRESVSARDKERLLALLKPVKLAAANAGFVKELVDSGRVFKPLAWTPREAHRFLQELPQLEHCGVIVRVPDWWKANAGPRPAVAVTLGSAAPSMVGLDAMLDFSVAVSLGGESVSEAELRALMAAGDGLQLLKGRWVEIDKQKLEQVLAHWKAVEREAQKGLSFADGMRLLAGVRLAQGDAAAPEQQGWSAVAAGPWLREQLQALRAPGAMAHPGPRLKAELRPYQSEGVRWLGLLSQLRLGACLADDMGLGKTVQVLALLLMLEERPKPGPAHLLVVPASLIANWKSEAERFAPSLQVAVLHPSELDVAAGAPKELASARVAVTSYGTLQRTRWMVEREWGVVVLDEAQAIKNPSAKQSRAVKELKGVARVALTGTPVENRVSDLWSLFDFLNPGLLGSAKQFGDFVKRSGSFGPLRELTRPYILRRLKTDKSVISDLPEKTEVPAFCALTKRQAALYQQSVEALKKELRVVDGMKRRGLVLSYLMRFKQICNHPSQWLADGEWRSDDSGKHGKLAELCETIAARQEKLLVFTQFQQMTEPLSRWLAVLFKRPGLVLSGDTQVKRRQEMVRRFQEDDEVPFFVLSLKAGGTGLNLTAASHVIHFDRWWNPAVENQATDRAFRIGQKRNVLVHKFVCRGTVEERVDAVIAAKQGLAKELLEGGAELKLTELSDGELLKMVSLDLNSARAEA